MLKTKSFFIAVSVLTTANLAVAEWFPPLAAPEVRAAREPASFGFDMGMLQNLGAGAGAGGFDMRALRRMMRGGMGGFGGLGGGRSYRQTRRQTVRSERRARARRTFSPRTARSVGGLNGTYNLRAAPGGDKIMLVHQAQSLALTGRTQSLLDESGNQQTWVEVNAGDRSAWVHSGAILNKQRRDEIVSQAGLPGEEVVGEPGPAPVATPATVPAPVPVETAPAETVSERPAAVPSTAPPPVVTAPAPVVTAPAAVEVEPILEDTPPPPPPPVAQPAPVAPVAPAAQSASVAQPPPAPVVNPPPAAAPPTVQARPQTASPQAKPKPDKECASNQQEIRSSEVLKEKLGANYNAWARWNGNGGSFIANGKVDPGPMGRTFMGLPVRDFPIQVCYDKEKFNGRPFLLVLGNQHPCLDEKCTRIHLSKKGLGGSDYVLSTPRSSR